MMEEMGQFHAFVGVLLVGVVAFLTIQKAIGRGRGKRARTSSDLFGAFDELFSPARYTTTAELQSHHSKGPVAPVPDLLERMNFVTRSQDGRIVRVHLDAAATRTSPAVTTPRQNVICHPVGTERRLGAP